MATSIQEPSDMSNIQGIGSAIETGSKRWIQAVLEGVEVVEGGVLISQSEAIYQALGNSKKLLLPCLMDCFKMMAPHSSICLRVTGLRKPAAP